MNCSGEYLAHQAGEGDSVRCRKCGEFARERDMTPTEKGNECPECVAMREDAPSFTRHSQVVPIAGVIPHKPDTLTASLWEIGLSGLRPPKL